VANRIVDDVYAAIVGKTQRCLAKICLAIENNVVGAALARYGGLILASDGCENARAPRLRQLYQQLADAAGAGVDQGNMHAAQ
jgi:hypothetical protein